LEEEKFFEFGFKKKGVWCVACGNF